MKLNLPRRAKRRLSPIEPQPLQVPDYPNQVRALDSCMTPSTKGDAFALKVIERAESGSASDRDRYESACRTCDSRDGAAQGAT